MDITIIIVTKDRSEFLRRMLRYYAGLKFKGRFLIGDSSTGEHLAKNKAAAAEFNAFFPVEFHEFPATPITVCHKILSGRIATAYSACISDSGFLTPAGLQQGIDFLNTHQDYVAADGTGVLFVLRDKENVYGQFEAVSENRGALRSVEDELPAARLVHYMRPYSVSMYSVYRAHVWQQIWRFADQMQEPYWGGEILPCALTAVYGKTKRLKVLASVRHMHQGRKTHGKGGFYWFLNPSWSDSFRLAFDVLTKELQRLQNISEENAQTAVREALTEYFKAAVNRKFPPVRPKSLKDHLKKNVLVRKVYDHSRRVLGAPDTVNLPKLLTQKSVYHDDFMPIYRLVTREGS